MASSPPPPSPIPDSSDVEDSIDWDALAREDSDEEMESPNPLLAEMLRDKWARPTAKWLLGYRRAPDMASSGAAEPIFHPLAGKVLPRGDTLEGPFRDPWERTMGGWILERREALRCPAVPDSTGLRTRITDSQERLAASLVEQAMAEYRIRQGLPLVDRGTAPPTGGISARGVAPAAVAPSSAPEKEEWEEDQGSGN